MDLKNKRVLVVGLGKSGLSSALFLRAQGAQVTVSDTRSAEALAKEIPALLDAGIMVGVGRPWAADLSAAGSDRGLAGSADGYSRGETGAGVWTAGDWGAGAGQPVSQGTSRGDYGLKREDDHNESAGQDLCRCRWSHARRRQHRIAGDRSGGEEHGGHGERAGGFELSTGDD